MVQNTVDFSDNPTGPELMDNYLAKLQDNVNTSNSGNQRPSYAVAGTKWLDTSVTPWLWKLYDGTSDIVLGTINPSTHLFTPAGVLPSQDGQSGKYLQTNGTETVWSDVVDYNNITNCLTEIPQDIKLELSNGTLTLKAGSKVYKGDGSVVDITSDKKLVAQILFNNVQGLLFYNPSKDDFCPFDRCFSGDTAPSVTGNTNFWYDTANKIVKYTDTAGSTWQDFNISLPIAIISVGESGAITSIDQVFNGFGYIGSHWFEIKGNKGKSRNGRNTDGSLNSLDKVCNNVMVRNAGDGTSNWYMYSNLSGIYRNSGKAVTYIQDEKPDVSGLSTNYALWESPKENLVRLTSNKGQTWTTSDLIRCGTYTTIDGRIDKFNPYNVFEATDYNDFKELNDRSAKVDETNEYTVAQPSVIKYGFSGNAVSLSKAVDTNNKAESAVYAYYTGNASYTRLSTLNKVPNKDFYVDVKVKDDGTAELVTGGSATFTIPTSSNSMGTIATTAWVNSKFKVVSTLPAKPDANVHYLIPEE